MAARTATEVPTEGAPKYGREEMPRSRSLSGAVSLVALVVAISVFLLWILWSALEELAGIWARDPKYSHGYLVPVFAAFLGWRRWRTQSPEIRPSWWGLLVLAAGLVLSLTGAYFFYPWFAETAILVVLTGLTVLLGGWDALGRLWPAIAFLIFMVPLPFRVEEMLAQPLQQLGTVASVYLLQTLGMVAHAQGNIIVLQGGKLGVAEACNGLGMLMTFIALTAGVTVFVRGPLWEKAILIASACPIALVCNIGRIAWTAVIRALLGPEVARLVYHDLSGWLMMPMALLLLWLEIRCIRWILRPAPVEAPIPA